MQVCGLWNFGFTGLRYARIEFGEGLLGVGGFGLSDFRGGCFAEWRVSEFFGIKALEVCRQVEGLGFRVL